MFASFFPASKGKPSKGTTTKGTAYVSTHEAARITGPGSVSAASKAVVTTGATSVTTHSESHSKTTKYTPEGMRHALTMHHLTECPFFYDLEPEEATVVKTKIKGKKWKRKGSRSRTGGESTSPPKKPAPTKGPPQFDFDALKDKFFGHDDDGDAVY